MPGDQAEPIGCPAVPAGTALEAKSAADAGRRSRRIEQVTRRVRQRAVELDAVWDQYQRQDLGRGLLQLEAAEQGGLAALCGELQKLLQWLTVDRECSRNHAGRQSQLRKLDVR